MSKSAIPEQLYALMEEELLKAGYQLVNVSAKGGDTFFMELIIDKPGGITIEECGKINRLLTNWLDENGVFEGNHIVEVCSPGLDRVLKSDTEFAWGVGRTVRITLYEPIDGKREITGRIERFDTTAREVTLIDAAERPINIKRIKIAHAKVCFDDNKQRGAK
jgi:ribosome maturation factor RimP